jgi:mono/diheme cytochrome c family protein
MFLKLTQDMTRKRSFIAVVAICIFAFSFSSFAQADGKALFMANCASCHNKNMKDKMTGPALYGVETRWSKKENLYAWIRNSSAFLKTGDAYANGLYNEYNKSVMTAFPSLKDEEIESVLAYIEGVGSGKIQDAPKADASSTASTANAVPTSIPSWMMWLLALILAVLAYILLQTNNILNRANAEKNGLPTPKDVTLSSIVKTRAFIAPAIFLTALFVGYFVMTSAINLGRSKGFAPKQPIAYSHKLHAGDMKIPCEYCHVGAYKGKNAVIPSTNVCMNCHQAVTKGSTTGETEIAKIYKAVDFDPTTKTYGKNQKPVEWVRIHNLPDHVYFNHSQHVNAGKIACQTCHGQIQEMEVVQQHAPLSMGWCINCHRETQVQFGTNGYYAEFEKLHEKLKKGEIKKVTAADVGGLECQKCHY